MKSEKIGKIIVAVFTAAIISFVYYIIYRLGLN